VPQQAADQIDLGVAQAAGTRPLDDARRLGGTEQRRHHAIGDHRTGRWQMAVHADHARERTQVRACMHELHAERMSAAASHGCARAHRDESVVEARAHVGDAERGELTSDLRDSLLECRRRNSYGESAQPRAPALKPLGWGDSRIGAELGDLELESLDHQRRDDQVLEHEPTHPAARGKDERQPSRAGNSSLWHATKLPALRRICSRLAGGTAEAPRQCRENVMQVR
jgi:hypothetical protein